MRIGFFIRNNTQYWGGDFGALGQFERGLEELGHTAFLTTNLDDALRCDHFCLTNTCSDLRSPAEYLQLLDIPYGVIGFHEDFLHYYTLATGFYFYIVHCLNQSLGQAYGFSSSLNHLLAYPNIVRYFGEIPYKPALYNAHVLKQAAVCIANSSTEANVMQRDAPSCRTKIIPLVSGIDSPAFDDCFLYFAGLCSNSYIVQVGRLERRKNQLATILATRDFDVPLVFIATAGLEPKYEDACVMAAARWRKAPTLFITQKPISDRGIQYNAKQVRMIRMPEEKKLSSELLKSALGHAGLHLHPAFLELPGLTLLEAAALGTPTITSRTCTVYDYFFDPALGHAHLDGRIVYTDPHDLRQIEALLPSLFGKRFSTSYHHPAFARKEKNIASDLLTALKA